MKKLIIVFVVIVTFISCSKVKNIQDDMSIQNEKSISTDRLEKKILYVISPEGLIVRDAPNGKELFIAEYKTRLELIDQIDTEKNQTINGVDGHWVKVKFYDEEGWVFNAYLSEEYPNENSTFDINTIPYTGESQILSRTYLDLEKYSGFICSPINDFPKYRFGWLNETFNATVKDVLLFCEKKELKYRLYSSGFGQGGGRSDVVKTKYFLIKYLRDDGNTENSSITVFNVQLYPNSELTYHGFIKYPETENDIVKYFGNPNYRNNDWLIYSNENGLVVIGIRLDNKKVECISIKQYLAD